MRLSTLVVCAVALAAPLAAAEWYVHGSVEPDTLQDAAGGYAWTGPDASPEGRRVYFNAVGNFYSTGVNPNSERAGSRVVAFPIQNVGAYLGVWKDCNADGYVGHGASALSEYRAELLPGIAVCPAGTEFNDGEWVYEFLWIASGFQPTSRGSPAQRAIVDREARVWGDHGLPGGLALDLAECEVFSQSQVTRPATPPSGHSFASTGGLLKWGDCWTGHNVARAVNSFGDTPLAFEDPENPQRSTSLLNQRLPANLFGDPDAPEGYRHGLVEGYDGSREDRAFDAWDCSRPKGAVDVYDPTATTDGEGRRQRGQLSSVAYSDPTGRLDDSAPGLFAPDGTTTLHLTDEEGTYFAAPWPAPSVRDPAGSYHGALHEAERGAMRPTPHHDERRDAAPAHHRRDACEGSSWNATDVALGAAYLPPPRDESTAARRSNDYAFRFLKHQTDPLHVARNESANLQRTLDGSAPAVAPLARPATDAARSFHPLGEDAPSGLGVDAIRFTSAVVGPGWFSDPRTTRPPVLDRHSLQPAGPDFDTFYAHVGAATLDRASVPPAPLARYGGEWCGTDFATDRVVRQFDCNAANWWDPRKDPRVPARSDGDGDGEPEGVFPGQRYHLRDVDCRDMGPGRGLPGPADLRPGGGCRWP